MNSKPRYYHSNKHRQLSGPRPTRIFIEESGVLLIYWRSLSGGFLDYDNLFRINQFLHLVQQDALGGKKITCLGIIGSPLNDETGYLEFEASRFYFPTRWDLTNYLLTFFTILYRLKAITVPKIFGCQASSIDLPSLFVLKSFDNCFVVGPENNSANYISF